MATRIIYAIEKILISAVTGVLSYKAINDDSKENENDVKPHILSFFIFIGFLNIIELFIEPFIQWIPMYYELKCILLFVVFFNTIYQNSDSFMNTVINPFFSFFDSCVTPKLVKGCDMMYYYVVVMLSPFINQEELEKMREYANRIIESTNKKIITNYSVL